MIVATTQFSLKPIADENEFFQRVHALCIEAKTNSADLILFPEYFSLSFLLCGETGSFMAQLKSGLKKSDSFKKELSEIAKKEKLTIVAGTIPHEEGKKIINRSWIFFSNGEVKFQDKIHMTRFESEEWKISEGDPNIQVFESNGIKCAVAICYDIEFPKYSTQLAKAGVELILVPSCTDDVHGYWRVRHCAEARAIENQSYVMMSSICEGNKNHMEISAHFGQEAIFSPCDVDFPTAGLLIQGRENREGISVAKVDIKMLQNVRKNGTVLNSKDSQKNISLQIKEN